jgi:hypothetical protein
LALPKTGRSDQKVANDIFAKGKKGYVGKAKNPNDTTKTSIA